MEQLKSLVLLSVAVRGCPQRSGRSRPVRGPSAALVDASLDQSTPCLQSQIGRVRHLARRRMAQVTAAVGLSVGVRLRPPGSVVNGTVVAQPVRMTPIHRAVGLTSTRGRLGSRASPAPYPECRCRNASVRALKSGTFS